MQFFGITRIVFDVVNRFIVELIKNKQPVYKNYSNFIPKKYLYFAILMFHLKINNNFSSPFIHQFLKN